MLTTWKYPSNHKHYQTVNGNLGITNESPYSLNIELYVHIVNVTTVEWRYKVNDAIK